MTLSSLAFPRRSSSNTPARTIRRMAAIARVRARRAVGRRMSAARRACRVLAVGGALRAMALTAPRTDAMPAAFAGDMVPRLAELVLTVGGKIPGRALMAAPRACRVARQLPAVRAAAPLTPTRARAVMLRRSRVWAGRRLPTPATWDLPARRAPTPAPRSASPACLCAFWWPWPSRCSASTWRSSRP